MPPQFISIKARAILWQKYGIALPNFTGEDALRAIYYESIEARRLEWMQKHLQSEIELDNG